MLGCNPSPPDDLNEILRQLILKKGVQGRVEDWKEGYIKELATVEDRRLTRLPEGVGARLEKLGTPVVPLRMRLEHIRRMVVERIG